VFCVENIRESGIMTEKSVLSTAEDLELKAIIDSNTDTETVLRKPIDIAQRNRLRICARRLIMMILGDLVYELERELNDCKSILDLGCGPCSPIQYLSNNFHSVGVDIFEPSIEKSRRRGIHDRYFLMDVLDVGMKFSRKSFDGVVAFDLIEHLQKEDGIKLITMMEKIAKKKVVILTPNGFLPQESYEGNVYQIHKSGWVTEEMRERGYRVIGINGWKPLRGEMGKVRFSPKRPLEWFSRLTQRAVRNRPEKAFALLCVKILS